MMNFSERLQDEMEYAGLTRKELAYTADIKPRALAMYLGTQKSMPPADVAVKLAKALNVTVEYLVTGENRPETKALTPAKPKIEQDLENCSEKTREFLKTAVHLFAAHEKRRARD